jgi:hypothetical protein
MSNNKSSKIITIPAVEEKQAGICSQIHGTDLDILFHFKILLMLLKVRYEARRCQLYPLSAFFTCGMGKAER